MNTTFKLGDIDYRIGAMDAFKQIAIARRLTSVLGEAITPDLVKSMRDQGKSPEPMAIISSILRAFGTMKDEDVEFILRNCLSVVARIDGDKGYPLMVSGELMYQSLTPVEVLTIAANVVADKLSTFIPALLAALPPSLFEAQKP